jgi:hypothetical protein
MTTTTATRSTCSTSKRDQPVWIEALRSNSAAEFTLPNNDGYYSSGRPASSHTYYQQQFIESLNRAVRFGVGAAASSGNGFADVDGFEVASGTLDPRHTFPPLPGATNAMTTAKDPASEDVFVFHSNLAVYKWTRATNAWSSVNAGWPPISARESAAAFDPVRGRIFLLKGAESAVCHTFEPATGLFTARTLTGDTAAVNAASKGIGMVYEADRFLVRLPDAGGAVYAIDPATFSSRRCRPAAATACRRSSRRASISAGCRCRCVVASSTFRATQRTPGSCARTEWPTRSRRRGSRQT